MRVAAIDCGTNSIRLLVADIEGDTLTDLDRRMEIVRLGEGVDNAGRLSSGALDRTFAACKDYAAIVSSYGINRIRFVATSATRDAANRGEFTSGVKDILGVEPEVISGDEEATLSFLGATRELTGLSTPYLVVDIGGGSTEFVLGEKDPVAARSVDMGCVRLTERLMRSDPPTRDEIDRAVGEIDERIAEAGELVPLHQARTLVGLAGSVTTVAAMALDLPRYIPERIHRSVISADQVHEVTARFLTMRKAERLALPYMHPGRADVIGGGALILDRIVHAVKANLAEPAVLVSEHDILDGIAWSLIA